MLKIIIALLALWASWWVFRFFWRIVRPIRTRIDNTVLDVAREAGLNRTAKVIETVNTKVDSTVESPANLKRVLIWTAIFVTVGLIAALIGSY